MTAHATELGEVTRAYGVAFVALALVALVALVARDQIALAASAIGAGLLVLHGAWYWAVTWGVFFSLGDASERCPPLAGGFAGYEQQYFPTWLACLSRAGDRVIVTPLGETLGFTAIPVVLTGLAVATLAWVISRTRRENRRERVTPTPA